MSTATFGAAVVALGAAASVTGICVVVLGLLAALVPLRLLLTPFPLWPAVLWAHTLLLVVAAGLLMALHRGIAGIRWLVAPLVVLLGVIPWPSIVEQNLILPLRESIAILVTELSNLIGKVERAGYTLVAIDLHFQRGRVKVEIGLAKGKKQFDKRQTEKDRDWVREKARLMRNKV